MCQWPKPSSVQIMSLLPSYYLDQWWLVVNWTHGKIFQWNLNQNTPNFHRIWIWKCSRLTGIHLISAWLCQQPHFRQVGYITQYALVIITFTPHLPSLVFFQFSILFMSFIFLIIHWYISFESWDFHLFLHLLPPWFIFDHLDEITFISCY